MDSNAYLAASLYFLLPSVLNFSFYKGQEKVEKSYSLQTHSSLVRIPGLWSILSPKVKIYPHPVLVHLHIMDLFFYYRSSSHSQSMQPGTPQNIISPLHRSNQIEKLAVLKKKTSTDLTKRAAHFYHHILFAQHVVLQTNVPTTVLLPFTLMLSPFLPDTVCRSATTSTLFFFFPSAFHQNSRLV